VFFAAYHYWVLVLMVSIYYHSEEQKKIAEASIAKQQTKYQAPIVTELLPATTFWPAEDYHQKYLEKGG